MLGLSTMRVKSGSSPLTRGKPDRLQRREQAPGLIPAHAGKTAHNRLAPVLMPAHPRSRGENSWLPSETNTTLGSSPLTRGKHSHRAGGKRQRRLIPAHAGKTASCEAWCCPSGAHPRSRGENSPSRIPPCSHTGSSPLTRGKPCRDPRRGRVRRLIPAHAGKTSCSRCVILAGRAHPRSRGENRAGGRNPVVETGSSPLTRGKPAPVVETEGLARLIPAHAGKTMETAASARFRRAHPRSRGENFNQSFRFSAGAGSSPLTRGKQSVLPACRVP